MSRNQAADEYSRHVYIIFFYVFIFAIYLQLLINLSSPLLTFFGRSKLFCLPFLTAFVYSSPLLCGPHTTFIYPSLYQPYYRPPQLSVRPCFCQPLCRRTAQAGIGSRLPLHQIISTQLSARPRFCQPLCRRTVQAGIGSRLPLHQIISTHLRARPRFCQPLCRRTAQVGNRQQTSSAPDHLDPVKRTPTFLLAPLPSYCSNGNRQQASSVLDHLAPVKTTLTFLLAALPSNLLRRGTDNRLTLHSISLTGFTMLSIRYPNIYNYTTPPQDHPFYFPTAYTQPLSVCIRSASSFMPSFSFISFTSYPTTLRC